jgi:prepilin-type processing-associated H-X9-DG protein
MHNYEGPYNGFPPGTIYAAWPGDPSIPPGNYRWGVLAFLTPFLEQTAVFNALNCSFPVYGVPTTTPPSQVYPANRTVVNLMIATFLCPSDRGARITTPDGFVGGTGREFSPTNYHFCAGSGVGGGDVNIADGIFGLNSLCRMQDISDGLSNTALGSETLIGPGGARSYAPNAIGWDPYSVYGQVASQGTVAASVTPEACANPVSIGPLRMAIWVDGSISYGMYNHHYPPNPKQMDCLITLNAVAHGWKAARSRHPGGANLLIADGSVRFGKDSTDPAVWMALGSRAGGEIATLP